MKQLVPSTKQFVDLHFAEISNVSDIPKALHVPYEQLRKIFVRETGETLSEYLHEVRVEKTKDLLNDHEEKLYTIAREVGYHNELALFRHFKSVTGMTPTEYRKSRV